MMEHNYHTILYELGKAYRGNWNYMDGRILRDELEDIAKAIEKGENIDLQVFREKYNLCPGGCGTWTYDDCECPE